MFMGQMKLKHTVLKNDDICVRETEFLFLMPTVLRFYSRDICINA